MKTSSQPWGYIRSFYINLRVILAIVRSHLSYMHRVWRLEIAHNSMWQWCCSTLGVHVLNPTCRANIIYRKKMTIKNLSNHPPSTDYTVLCILHQLSVSATQPGFPQNWNRWPWLFLWWSSRWSSWLELKGHIVEGEMTYICTYSWVLFSFVEHRVDFKQRKCLCT